MSTNTIVERLKSVAEDLDNQRTNMIPALQHTLKRLAAIIAEMGKAKPVAIYRGRYIIDCGETGSHDIEMLKLIPKNMPLFTYPQPVEKAVMLSDAEIDNITMAEWGIYANLPAHRAYARAIEKQIIGVSE